MAFRILSLDGGGVRGAFTAVLLRRLEEKYPNFLSNVDLFAGTSTGGIIALGLAAGLSPGDLVYLYKTYAQEIFSDSLWDNIKDLGGAIGAKYGNGRLRSVLTRYFGPRPLKSLKAKVLIPTFDLDNLDRPP